MLLLFRIIFPGNIYFIILFEEQWFLKKHILLFDSEGCFLSKLVCYFIADIDECNKIVNGVISKGGCQHKCNNTIGSYSCSCNDGFVLAYDRRTCLGIRKIFFSLVCFLLRKLFNHREQRKEEIYSIIQTMISIFYEHLSKRFPKKHTWWDINFRQPWKCLKTWPWKLSLENLLNIYKHFLGLTPDLQKFLTLLCFSCKIPSNSSALLKDLKKRSENLEI